MDCASCALGVERALLSLGGVEGVRVDVMGERVTVAYAEGRVARSAMAEAIERLGYRVAEGERPRVAEAEGEAGGWARHGQLALTLFAGVLWASSLVAGHLLGRSSAAAALAVLAVVAGGRYIFPRGVRALRSRALDMNFLMSIAAVGALGIGEYGEAASAVFLFALAQLLESYSVDRARRAVQQLMALSPAEAVVLRGGRELRVPAEEVVVGEVVVVRPGEKIPVDGVVTAGASSVDQAPITGESVPVEKEAGAEVFAGTLNGAGALEIRSTRPAEDTTLARIIHSVEEAQGSRAPTQAFVERFARVYTPAVVAVAAAVALLPPLLGVGGWGDWFYRALVLLVIACPCALVISTPVTIVSALAGAARRGILIKGGLHLENAGRARVVALDKTGTLTAGEPEVVDIVSLGDRPPAELLRLAAAAERRSEHPLARAILRRAEEAGLEPEAATNTAALTGLGVEARLGKRTIVVGSARLFGERGALDAAARRALERLEGEGRTVVLVGEARPEGLVAEGAIALADRVRAEAAGALRALHAAGIERVVMLTGDREGAAAAVATSLGAGAVDEVHASLLPEDKVAAVRALRERHGAVLFVGDGVNDAPALAAADVGIAMGAGGSDVALETADIALMADDLSRLPVTIRFARKAERIIRANIAFSLLTKGAFLMLALSGHATLWMAVLADVGASVLVVGNGMRALGVGEATPPRPLRKPRRG
jgi:Cd2+/Zn2+-exporting ATPase